jgi:hypothetical protein
VQPPAVPVHAVCNHQQSLCACTTCPRVQPPAVPASVCHVHSTMHMHVSKRRRHCTLQPHLHGACKLLCTNPFVNLTAFVYQTPLYAAATGSPAMDGACHAWSPESCHSTLSCMVTRNHAWSLSCMVTVMHGHKKAACHAWSQESCHSTHAPRTTHIYLSTYSSIYRFA